MHPTSRDRLLILLVHLISPSAAITNKTIDSFSIIPGMYCRMRFPSPALIIKQPQKIGKKLNIEPSIELFSRQETLLHDVGLSTDPARVPW